MIKYFVRTTLERKLNESYNQIEYELLIDTEHKANESFFKQLELISEYDAVLLEDDIKLCKNFKAEIEKVISEHPHDIINFFYKPHEWFTSHYSMSFAWNQCTYYPKGIGKIIVNEVRKHELPKVGYDTIEGNAMQSLGIKFYVYRPSLVQHLDKKSLINKGNLTGTRYTPFFKDYLDDLNIDYNNTEKLSQNIDILYKMCKEDIKKTPN